MHNYRDVTCRMRRRWWGGREGGWIVSKIVLLYWITQWDRALRAHIYTPQRFYTSACIQSPQLSATDHLMKRCFMRCQKKRLFIDLIMAAVILYTPPERPPSSAIACSSAEKVTLPKLLACRTCLGWCDQKDFIKQTLDSWWGKISYLECVWSWQFLCWRSVWFSVCRLCWIADTSRDLINPLL